jgi:hypothetical protein
MARYNSTMYISPDQLDEAIDSVEARVPGNLTREQAEKAVEAMMDTLDIEVEE